MRVALALLLCWCFIALSSACYPTTQGWGSGPNGVSRDQWWCNSYYGFLGFSYPLEDDNCNDYSYSGFKNDFQKQKQQYGATFVRIYLPTCRQTSFWVNMVKAARDTSMGLIPMVFWDWQQNDGVMNAAENALLGVFNDPEVGSIASYVIHSVAFGDELGEQGNYWITPMQNFKAKLAQHGVLVSISDDWDRRVYQTGSGLTSFGKQVNALGDLTQAHIQPYYHPGAVHSASDAWPYIQTQLNNLANNNKRPIFISQTMWSYNQNGHNRGQYDQYDNMQNYQTYWKSMNDNFATFKNLQIGWFFHTWRGEPGFDLIGDNNAPMFDFRPQTAPSNPSSTTATSSTTAAATTASATSSPACGYTLEDNFSGNNFFNNFQFFTAPDPTHGYVYYASASDSANWGFTSVNNGIVYIRSDHTSVSSGSGRGSVRITSNKVYNGGLFLFDVIHMPIGCGTWPAIWTVGPNWPNEGEIDVIEGVNNGNRNSMTLHTKAGCNMPSNPLETGSAGSRNCQGNQGCGVTDSRTSSYGTGFNNIGGGVHAMLWSSSGVKVWFFSRNAIPSDISSGHPNPDSWGTAAANFPFGSNCPSNFFQNHQIVLDNTFCGDWAGATFNSMGCSGSCQSFVQNNPSAFSESYWAINSFKVYQPPANGVYCPATSATSAATTATTAATTATTAATTATTAATTATTATTAATTATTAATTATTAATTATTAATTATTAATTATTSATTATTASSTTAQPTSGTATTGNVDCLNLTGLYCTSSTKFKFCPQNVEQSCAAGTVCQQSGSSIICDFP